MALQSNADLRLLNGLLPVISIQSINISNETIITITTKPYNDSRQAALK
jgi:hypothetical protein